MITQISNYHYTLLNVVSNRVLNKKLNAKYNGILEGYDLQKYSSELIDKLIELGVYSELKLENPIEDSFYWSLKDMEYSFGPELIYNNKLYALSDELHSEIFTTLKYIAEEYSSSIVEQDLNILISELNGFIKVDEKIIFLKLKHQKLWEPNDNTDQFMIYMGFSKSEIYKNWEDYVINYLSFDGHYYEFYLSLKGRKEVEESIFYNNIYKNWVNFYRLKNLIEFCKEKINEFEANSKQSENSLSQLIFKNDGYKVFEHIVSKYSEEKNKAFFSYLYSFLRTKDKIIKDRIDNKDYRDFIYEHFGIKMSRVIQSSPNNPKTESERHETFLNYMKTYSVND